MRRKMNLLAKLLRGVAFIPAIVHGIEALFGGKSGSDKKEAAMSFIGAALSITEAVASKDIVDDGKFKDGLSKVIDGVVQCLNASAWAVK
jgi:NhaP-type Na+/H+ or K+/H+ antiporter